MTDSRSGPWERIGYGGPSRWIDDPDWEVRRVVADDPNRFELVSRSTGTAVPLSASDLYGALDEAERKIKERS